MESIFVALNILSNNNVVLNSNAAPLIFYWTGDIDIIEDLSNQKEFKDFLFKIGILSDPEKFFTHKISYVYYNGTECNQSEIYIKDIFKLNNLNDVINNILKYALSNLYCIAFNDNKPDFNIISIKSAYDNIINKYNGRVSVNTVKNYIRYLIFEKYKLSGEIISFLIKKLEDKTI